MNHGRLQWFEMAHRWDKGTSAISNNKIKTDNSRVSDTNDFWFDFKKEWIFLLCPLLFLIVLFVSKQEVANEIHCAPYLKLKTL